MRYTLNMVLLFTFFNSCILFAPLVAPLVANAGDSISFAPTLPPWRLRQELQQSDSVVNNGLKAMRQGYFSVVEKRNLPYGIDPHIYRSLAPHWWPDKTTRDGLPYTYRNGQPNPEALGRNFDAARLQGLSETVASLVLSYRLTADKAAAKRAAELLRIWFIKPETRMLPNMSTAHIRPGQRGDITETGRDISAANMVGSPEGIIEARHLITLCNAVALLDNDLIWTAQDKQAVTSWMSDFRHWLDSSAAGAAHRNMQGYHGTWDDALRVALALFVGDSDGARTVIEQHSLPRIAQQFMADGSQPKELVHPDSLNDSLFNLEAWAALAIMGQRLGLEVWHHTAPNDATVAQGLLFVLSYRDKPQNWPWAQQAALNIDRLDALKQIVQGLDRQTTPAE